MVDKCNEGLLFHSFYRQLEDGYKGNMSVFVSNPDRSGEDLHKGVKRNNRVFLYGNGVKL